MILELQFPLGLDSLRTSILWSYSLDQQYFGFYLRLDGWWIDWLLYSIDVRCLFIRVIILIFLERGTPSRRARDHALYLIIER